MLTTDQLFLLLCTRTDPQPDLQIPSYLDPASLSIALQSLSSRDLTNLRIPPPQEALLRTTQPIPAQVTGYALFRIVDVKVDVSLA